MDLLRRTGGFHDIKRATFDQEHLALWKAAGGEPGRPDDFSPPQYVYGWGRAPRHVSLEMGDQSGWYDNYATRAMRSELELQQILLPRMDDQPDREKPSAFFFLSSANSLVRPSVTRIDFGIARHFAR